MGGNEMPTRPVTPEVRLAHLTSSRIDSGSFDKAILPIGATEFHGPHLPYGTDTIGAETIAEAIARELGNTLVLPPLAYGVSHHHLSWHWTVSTRPDTLMYLIRDIGESLLANNIRKLVFLTAHDGNRAPAEGAARLLHQTHGISIALMDGWQGRARKALAGTEWDIDPDHGGQSELSIVLYGAPETAKPERATPEQRQNMEVAVEVIGDFGGTVPKGFSGNASKASAEEGEPICQALVRDVIPFLRKLEANGWQRGAFMSGIDE
jgi:creatinine amidohydrolase